MSVGLVVLIILGSYLLGSIPTAYCIVKFRTGTDIRTVGSGNVGSTNALRAAGKKIAAVVLLGDALKGTLPSLLGLVLSGPAFGIVCGLAAFLGHIYSPWLRFHGGKGVATQLGIVLALSPLSLIMPFAAWVVTVLISGYVSLASCIAVVLLVISLLVSGAELPYIIGFSVMMVIVFIKHRQNFRNIKNGSELKISFRK